MRYARVIVGLAVALLLSASPASAGSLTVAWDPNTDGGLTTGYFVYYGTASRTYSGRVDAGSATSFAVAGLADGTKYFLAVRAYDKNGVLSDWSAEVSATTPGGGGGGTPPPPPGGGAPGNGPQLTASIRADRFIDLAWELPAGAQATSYRVEVGTLPTFTSFSAVTTERRVTFDMSDMVVPAYFIRVRPVAGGTFGAVSNEVAVTPAAIDVPNDAPGTGNCVAPPGAPRRFFSSAVGGLVTLTWQRGQGDVTSGYSLEVGTAPGLANLLVVTLGNVTSLSANASAGVFALRMRATNGCGLSTWGAESMLTVGAGPGQAPGAPEALTSRVTGNTVSLTWAHPSTGGAPTHYVIEATLPGGALLTFNTGSTTPGATFSGVPPGRYVVRVRGGNPTGLGPASASVTIVVQ